MLSDEEIDEAKKQIRYSLPDGGHHQHNDCIRIAYEWLDAQKKIKTTSRKGYALKHLIEKWGGRYVSTSDVEVAAFLHPDIEGEYPHFNISARLTMPSDQRLKNISEAFKHNNYRKSFDPSLYKEAE